ncbi:hypothetical protein [Zhenhengia yiwuensis]|uniref:Uncharacterized protein n=1 Tax=Zhenhengia yiwuensis TaxID=2763666 RepID=A0A926EKA5_9FIRM|nr:hypothetical protein [Zhenhengia yiwuensis]MBC8579618.1 hypothetical protein [Zhenhengia yiwuensis]MDY3367251.1 hypothetical protein [Zhenhengia yiwuensis]
MTAFVQYAILYMARKMGLILGDPIFFIMVLYSIVVYKRQIEKIKGKIPFKYLVGAIGQDLIVGIFIGIIGSCLLSYKGINFEVDTNILVLIPIAFLLIMIHPRFGCFSYVIPVAFMIEGGMRIIGGIFYQLNYPMLVSLVGILHILEGLLVIASGWHHAYSVPIYENKKLVTYKMMRHIWIVPLFFNLLGTSTVVPLYALLAYGDHAKVRSTKAQSFLTGCLILTFGLILTLLGYYIHPKGLQASGIILLMPVLHELIFMVEEYCNKN